jgi:hypothetical protein
LYQLLAAASDGLHQGPQPQQTNAVHGSNCEKFGIHSPVDLTQISRQSLEILLALFMDLPCAILCYYGAPLTQISATLRNMQSYAQRRGLDKNYFDGRVD